MIRRHSHHGSSLCLRAAFVVGSTAAAVSVTASGSGVYSVRFDQPVYFVQPGQSSVPVGILIDPAPVSGLFSYGVTLKFDSAMASVPDSSAVKVVPPLNFDGVRGAGANIQLAAGSASVKGSVDTSLPAGTAYSGSLIGVFEIKNQAPAGSSYSWNFF